MKIDLTKLIYGYQNEILIDNDIFIDQSYYKSTEIRSISKIKVSGSIKTNNDETLSLNLKIYGTMVLPCSITLEDVIYPFDIEINEMISFDNVKNEEYLKIINNSLDIMPIIWQNIVVEIPLKVVSPNIDRNEIRGDGWELLPDEGKNTDSRFDILKNLLDKKED